MMDIFVVVIVAATLYFIVRGTDVRRARPAGAAALTIASLKPEAWFNAFASSVVQAGLLTFIVLGFLD
jgi:hypothetical protein